MPKADRPRSAGDRDSDSELTFTPHTVERLAARRAGLLAAIARDRER
jgi:hypothetical protein